MLSSGVHDGCGLWWKEPGYEARLPGMPGCGKAHVRVMSCPLFARLTLHAWYEVWYFPALQISVHYLNPTDPPLDVALMSRADYFIGNCISSFTAFVKRERDVYSRPTEFFGFETVKVQNSHEKTEL